MKRSTLLILLAMLLSFYESAKAEEDDLETKVKAAYIFNFTRFVEWGGYSGDTLTICVVGGSSIARILRDLAARHRERPFRVEHEQISDLRRCQLLYIDQSEEMLSDLIAKAADAEVLTVSDAKNFAQKGGVIGFYIDEGKVKLEINQKIAKAANLKISSKLMEIARIVP